MSDLRKKDRPFFQTEVWRRSVGLIVFLSNCRDQKSKIQRFWNLYNLVLAMVVMICSDENCITNWLVQGRYFRRKRVCLWKVNLKGIGRHSRVSIGQNKSLCPTKYIAFVIGLVGANFSQKTLSMTNPGPLVGLDIYSFSLWCMEDRVKSSPTILWQC